MKSTMLNNFILIMVKHATEIENLKHDLRSVVSPDEFESINDCVIALGAATDVNIKRIYSAAYVNVTTKGWTKYDFIQWANRWGAI